MTQTQGKFQKVPPSFEAIQWDGTLTGASEIFKFIDEQLDERSYSGPINFKARIVSDKGTSREVIVLSPEIIGEEYEDNRSMWEGAWLVFCPNPRSWKIWTDERFKQNFAPVQEIQ